MSSRTQEGPRGSLSFTAAKEPQSFPAIEPHELYPPILGHRHVCGAELSCSERPEADPGPWPWTAPAVNVHFALTAEERWTVLSGGTGWDPPSSDVRLRP